MKNKINKYFIIFIMAMILMAINVANTLGVENSSNKRKVLGDYLDSIDWNLSDIADMNDADNIDDILDKNSIIVRFKPDVSDLDISIFENEFNLQNKKQLTDEIDFFYYSLPDDVKVSLMLLAEINESPAVLYVEPNYKCTISAEPNFNELWNLNNQTYPQMDINIEKAWEITKGDPSVVVALIDSGIDYDHPYLRDKIWVNTKEIPDNEIDDDNNGYIDDIMGWNFYGNNNPMDGYSHGTHVAGIIAASEIGIAPEVKLLPLKIFGEDGGISNYSDVISAIVYAYNSGASIVNMSFGGKGYSQSLCDIMDKYENMLFVSAAGNRGLDNDMNPFYPGSYELENNICVASIDEDGSLSGYSDFGVEQVHVAAPGTNIYSTIPNAEFGYKSGTSMSAPHVTGIAALLKSYNADLTASQIKQIIMDTVRPIESLEGKIKTGGLVDAGKALNSVKQTTLPPDEEDKIIGCK